MPAQVIIGGGDIGRRLVSLLKNQPGSAASITVTTRSDQSRELAEQLGVKAVILDLDDHCAAPEYCRDAEMYYTVPPQNTGVTDRRSQHLIQSLSEGGIMPRKVVLISTTGVYGDCGGRWVDESSPAQPTTERAIRRLDCETQWLRWSSQNEVEMVILRVPGIYAFSRIPRERLHRREPVVAGSECGYTNRIHADDLAAIMLAAMRSGRAQEVYNASDGVPGKISEYLQAAARVLAIPALPEISLAEAKHVLSDSMLSYLAESRKISNRKMLDQLQVVLRYPDFNQGLKHG